VIKAQVEVRATQLALRRFLGKRAAASKVLLPRGDLAIAAHHFQLSDLLASAQKHRPDLLEQQRALRGQASRIELASSSRVVDVVLGVGWQHNFSTNANAFRQPDNDTITATLAVPVPLSNVYRGGVIAAQRAQSQQRLAVDATRLRVDVEVQQALARYTAAVERNQLYRGNILRDAERVLEATLYQYKRGDASLLEVLTAQRTVDDVYLTYYEVLADHARALVAVEQTAGLWDIRF